MKVLIVRVGAMGDVVHALPAVAALKRARPEWHVDWAVDPRWDALLMGEDERGPVVDMLHRVPVREWKAAPFSRATLRSVLELRKRLREEHYDVVVDMQGTMRSAVIGRMAGAETFAGYSDPRESMAATLYGREMARRGTHVVEQGAALLGEACGVALMPGAVEIPRIEWAENWAEQEAVLRRPMCVLSAGGGWGAKLWPAERFGELGAALRAMGFDVVVNAPRKDNVEAARVVAASHGAVRMVVCNVAGLVALLRRADLMVGGDTGPMHVAAALGVPVVALFGPTSPERNGPWGPGRSVVVRDGSSVSSYKKSAAVEAGLAKVSVERVLEAVRGLGLVAGPSTGVRF
jgi:heptosyltransferase-1